MSNFKYELDQILNTMYQKILETPFPPGPQDRANFKYELNHFRYPELEHFNNNYTKNINILSYITNKKKVRVT